MSKKEPGKDKSFTTGRKSKQEELLKTVQQAQAPLIKALNDNREFMKHQSERLKTLEDNQTQFVKVLEQMRANPGGQGQPQQGGNTAQGGMAGMGQMFQSLIMREMMGGGQNPTKMALDIAREFNKTYMTGQRNMIQMLRLMSKKKSLDDIFPEEE